MYQAKQSGRNRIEAFDANEDRSQRENHIKGQRILQGLHHHEFVLHVQPKVDMQSGQVIGVEALAQWQHPQQGLLTPQHFLPHIEGGELELAFGQWSIMQALDILEDFQQQGLSLPVAVNLSPTHLQHSHFTQWMASQLQAHPRIPPRLLDLEITENAALHDMQKMSQVLKALRALGLNISLDDFGTGYSSLTYLSKLPLDSLKIDRSFVCDMLTDRAHRAIVHGVITMASSFGCKVIAEGVESHEQCACLSDMGCHWAQGFYFARPHGGRGLLPLAADPGADQPATAGQLSIAAIPCTSTQSKPPRCGKLARHHLASVIGLQALTPAQPGLSLAVRP